MRLWRRSVRTRLFAAASVLVLAAAGVAVIRLGTHRSHAPRDVSSAPAETASPSASAPTSPTPAVTPSQAQRSRPKLTRSDEPVLGRSLTRYSAMDGDRFLVAFGDLFVQTGRANEIYYFRGGASDEIGWYAGAHALVRISPTGHIKATLHTTGLTPSYYLDPGMTFDDTGVWVGARRYGNGEAPKSSCAPVQPVGQSKYDVYLMHLDLKTLCPDRILHVDVEINIDYAVAFTRLAYTNGYLWGVAGPNYRIDPVTAEVVQLQDGGGQEIAVAEGAIWTVSSGAGSGDTYEPTITRVDPSTMKATATITLPKRDHVNWIGMAVGGDSMWVSFAPSNVLTRIDLRGATAEDAGVQISSNVKCLAWADDRLYAGCSSVPIQVFDVARGTRLADVPGSKGFFGHMTTLDGVLWVGTGVDGLFWADIH